MYEVAGGETTRDENGCIQTTCFSYSVSSSCQHCDNPSCVAVCPRHVITPVPYEADIVVACNSHAKGVAVTKGCSIGCLGCGKCEKICPNDAIHVVDNLAQIDYSKCVSCGLCAEHCPRHLISDANLRQDMDLAEARAR